ncbi:MAG: pseudouridine synthase [Dehalococcoidia bacterium]
MAQYPDRPKLPPGSQTLVKYLVAAGLGSRRDCADLIMAGRVRVNGLPALDLTRAVRARDRVDVNGKPARVEAAKPVYLLLNKPTGYLSTVEDDRGRKTVLDLVPEGQRLPGLVPAGRLDLDSTGLMLLTNDGNLVDMVTHPRYGVEKEYRVLVDHPLSEDRVRALVAGIPMEEGVARAKSIRRLTAQDGEFRYAITLVEGKKREVRRMLIAVERRVLELERTRLGNITLGKLPPGQVRQMTASELRGLLAAVDQHPEDRRPAHAEQDDRDQPYQRPPERRAGPGGQNERAGQYARPPERRTGPRSEGERDRPYARPPERRTGPRQQSDRDRPYARPPERRSGPRSEGDRDRPYARPPERRPGPRSEGDRDRPYARPPERRTGPRQQSDRDRPYARPPERRPGPRSEGERDRPYARPPERRSGPRGEGGRDRPYARPPERRAGPRDQGDRDRPYVRPPERRAGPRQNAPQRDQRNERQRTPARPPRRNAPRPAPKRPAR